ncbi:MAG: [LysW]-lysine hydrolase [Thermomicrobiales bacterium]
MTSSSLPDVPVAPASAEDIELIRRLVEIESLSDHEGAAVAELVRQMDKRGFDAEIDAAGNAVGRIGSGDRHVVLLGHIDTVPGRIPVRIEDGVLWGRGSVDAKGPLCTFVAAAAMAATKLKCRVTVVGAVGEERIGSPGAREVAKWDAPDFCVIGEPSAWDAVCLGYRGTLSFVYERKQASRHTAGPGEPTSEQAVAFWNALVAHCNDLNAAVENRTMFTTLTPTLRVMRGGITELVDSSMMSIGLRMPPGIDTEALLTKLDDLAGPGTITLDGVQEGYRSARTSPIVPPFLRAIRAEGGNPRFTVKLGTSDMTIVGPIWQCPILAYGPGDAALDHTPEERLELDDYARAIRVLAGALEAM